MANPLCGPRGYRPPATLGIYLKALAHGFSRGTLDGYSRSASRRVQQYPAPRDA